MNPKNQIHFKVTNLAKPDRLDRVLRAQYPDWGRKAVNHLIQTRQVAVNGKTVWLNSWTVKNDDWIVVQKLPDPRPESFTNFDARWVIRDEGDIIAINKPHGLLSMKGKHGKAQDLHTLMVAHFGSVSLFHRLDRDTSGVILFTRNSGNINRYLDEAFKTHHIEKTYFAWVHKPNDLEDNGTIELRIGADPARRDVMKIVEKGGQSAVTHYQVIQEEYLAQLVKLMPWTGRTHQLRVHLAAMNAPILGDRLYSKTWRGYSRLYLHAHSITLPETDTYPQRDFCAPINWDLPDFMKDNTPN